VSVTLSVEELTRQLLDAFKLEVPELSSFTQDFSSKTAVLGDRITAKISHIPLTAAYDLTPRVGFYGGAQDVTTLIEDVSVTLNQLRHVPVKLAWLQGLTSKVDLLKPALANMAHALGKYVLDQILFTAATGAVSNSFVLNPLLVSLESFEALRSQCNAQKIANTGRFCFLNGALAGALLQDDRVKSELFYGQKDGAAGFRRFKNIAGFSWLREYQDFPGGGINAAGLCGDKRLAVVSVRPIEDVSLNVEALGIPKVMGFYPVKDDESGLSMTGVSWQEAGTGDVYFSAAILFGIEVGNQGGVPGSCTDTAGLLITSL
jgi:hypothetical protein